MKGRVKGPVMQLAMWSPQANKAQQKVQAKAQVRAQATPAVTWPDQAKTHKSSTRIEQEMPP